MAQNWTSRMTRKASTFGRVFRVPSRPGGNVENDADALALGVGHGDGRQQRSRVGVPWR